MKALRRSDLIEFKTSEEFRCLENSLAEKIDYLNVKYNLFHNTRESNQLIKDALHLASTNKSYAKIVEVTCFDAWMIWVAWCSFSYPNNNQGYLNCLNDAFTMWLLCEGA